MSIRRTVRVPLAIEEDVMTAITLSSLSYHSLFIQETAPVATGGRDTPQACRGTAAREDQVLEVSAQSVAPTPGPAAPTPSAVRPQDMDRMEHRARGLLNLIALLSRCLAGGSGSPAERGEWRNEIDEASERLEALYDAGLPRTFLPGPPPTTRGSARDPGVAVPAADRRE